MKLTKLLSLPFMLILGITLVGCESDKDLSERLQAAKAKWQTHDPQYYSYEFESYCMVCDFGALQVSWVDDLIVAAKTPEGTHIPEHFKGHALSVNDAFSVIEYALNSDADVIDADFHPEYGNPIYIHIDYDKDAADDEISYHFNNTITGGKELALADIETRELFGFTTFSGWQEALPQFAVTIEFNVEQLTFGGHTGCNAYGGTIALQNGEVYLKPTQKTEQNCDAPEGVMQQESEFWNGLVALQDSPLQISRDFVSYSAAADLGMTFGPDFKRIIEVVDVASYKKSCVGLSYKLCLMTKLESEQDYSYFYDNITRFQHRWGTTSTFYQRKTPVSYDTVSIDNGSYYYYFAASIDSVEDEVGTEYRDETFNLQNDAILATNESGIYRLSDGTKFACADGVNCSDITEWYTSMEQIDVIWRYTGDSEVPLQLAAWN